MQPIELYIDPTSEPCRAVIWMAELCKVKYSVHYIWLSKNQHLDAGFLDVNPRHQVPALKHGDFCLSEAIAIMQYIAQICGVEQNFFGDTAQQKARITQQISWYHLNLKRALTLDYFLPVLLMPVYLGIAPPTDVDLEQRKSALKEVLIQLDVFILDSQFIQINKPSSVDILFASEISALEIDKEFPDILERFPNIANWYHGLKQTQEYEASHRIWNFIKTEIKSRLAKIDEGELSVNIQLGDPGWVADMCEAAV